LGREVRVAFFGTAPFGIPTLEAISDHPIHELIAIVTGADKVRGRGRRLSPTPVGEWAASRGISPVLKPGRLRDEAFIQELRALEAGVFVVVAFRILPESVFSLPRYAFNLHASLLPAYRGAAPVQRAIMAGETTTGVTTFLLQKTVDTGAVLGQREVMIEPDETAGLLTDRLATVGSRLVIETLDRLAVGDDSAQIQDDNLKSSAPKIGREEQRLHFDRTARSLINQVRALAPRPGAVARLGERTVKVLALSDAGPITGNIQVPGSLIAADPRRGLIVATADRAVHVERIQPDGKKEQSGAEFVRGYQVKPGEKFTPVD
jgi:methionyl-tRNA formyltransferase